MSVQTSESWSRESWAAVIGQSDAVTALQQWVAEPVHAFMFTGPAGGGKAAAAFVFAGEVLAHGLDEETADRHRRRAVGRTHPDIEFYSPAANQLAVDEIRQLIPLIYKKPIEGRRRIVIVDRFDSANDQGAAALLKHVEEPPPGTVLIILREVAHPEHVAVASRCVGVAFGPIPDDAVAATLMAEGASSQRAADIAAAAAGNLKRARLLLSDQGFEARSAAWQGAPARLDGSGYAASEIVRELREMLDQAVATLEPVHTAEIEELAAREEALGTRGSGRTEIVARHKREVRKIRTDELRYGFGVLARLYSAGLAAGGAPRLIEAIDRLRQANEDLARNPNEELLLLNLFWQLPPL